MQKTKIEWVRNPDGKQGIVFNPIIGCKNNCYYCYGKELNRRFKWIKDWTKPENCGEDYYTKSICQIYTIRPKTIFIGSMTDLFGKWIEKEVIEHYLIWTKENPQHTFLFLTKDPERYANFKFSRNCWLGATVNCQKDVWRIDTMRDIENHNKVFLSIEPLLGKINYSLRKINWVIVGIMTGKYAKQYIPQKEWVDEVIKQAEEYDVPVFVKDNLLKLYPQYGEYRDIPYTDRRYKLFKETIETGKGR